MTSLDTAVTTTIDALDTLIERHRYYLLPAIDAEVHAAGVAREDAHDLRARLERNDHPDQHAALTTDWRPRSPPPRQPTWPPPTPNSYAMTSKTISEHC